MGNLIALCTLLLVMNGCGSQMDYERQSEYGRTLDQTERSDGVTPLAPEQPAVQPKFDFQLNYTDELGQAQILSNQVDNKNVVLIFSQEFCDTCIEETKMLIGKLNTQNPLQVNVLTLLVGAIAEDAAAWKDFHQVPWSVGIDPDFTLMPQYCPQDTVPCIVVIDRVRGVLLRHHGSYPWEDLVALTGPWQN